MTKAPNLQDIFLAAANPVFLLAVDKPGQEEDQG